MNIVTCNCKKKFAVKIPNKEAKAETTDKIFHIALCPECKMLVRFQANQTEEMEEGTYTGRLEISDI